MIFLIAFCTRMFWSARPASPQGSPGSPQSRMILGGLFQWYKYLNSDTVFGEWCFHQENIDFFVFCLNSDQDAGSHAFSLRVSHFPQVFLFFFWIKLLFLLVKASLSQVYSVSCWYCKPEAERVKIVLAFLKTLPKFYLLLDFWSLKSGFSHLPGRRATNLNALCTNCV